MNKLKNFMIVVLFITAIIQTNILWLENISYHNFFYKIKDPEKKIAYNLAENFRLIIRDGKNFSITYKPDSHTKKITDAAIINILDEGKIIEKTQFNFENEISKSVFIYDYDFTMSIEDFAQCFNKNPNNFSQIKMFDKIFFETDSTISFANTNEKKLYRYVSHNKFILSLPDSLQNNYIYNKKFMLAKTISVPQLKINNPYAENGDIFMNSIAKKLDMFFDNSATVNIDNVNTIFTFSNESVLVKYFPANILEYTNYKIGKQNSDLLSHYETAVNFIANDSYVKNEYILKRYEKNENAYTFYFDYLVNNLPVEIENGFAKQNELENFICITVKNNTVSKYKKVVFNFEPTQSFFGYKIEKYYFDGNLLSQF